MTKIFIFLSFTKTIWYNNNKKKLLDYTSVQKINITSLIEVCDGGYHGLGDLTWNEPFTYFYLKVKSTTRDKIVCYFSYDCIQIWTTCKLKLNLK